MRIYLMRHLEKLKDKSIYTPLDQKGIVKREIINDLLKDIDVNIIYSSPYLYCFQSVDNYIKQTETKVIMEHGIREYMDERLVIDKENDLPKYIKNHFRINDGYIKKEELSYPEKEEEFKKRIKRFLRNLIKEHGKEDKRILIISHQSVLNEIISYAFKSIHKEIPEKYQDLKKYYLRNGDIIKIFDDSNWVFKEIKKS
jgi:broad specificity phosphatase PhoE